MMISMSSCLMKREHMYHFSKSDSLYFEVYDTLQSYVFKTNKGTDTLRFVEKNIVENYNEWYFDQVDGSIFNAQFYMEGRLKHHGHNEKIFILFVKESDDQDPTMEMGLGERYAIPIEDERNYVNGMYKDTIIVDAKNSILRNDFPHYYTFDYLKWHKYKGIVEYKLSDGTIYKDSIVSLGREIWYVKHSVVEGTEFNFVSR